MKRVLPRDAFNDANLLKCIGVLTMLIEDRMHSVEGLSFVYDGEAFDIQQDETNGETCVMNICFFLKGEHCYFYRPMNSREAWPLMMRYKENEYYVFNNDGEIMPAFNHL